MIESDKPDQSTSDGRGSDASVSRRGFLKRLTSGGAMLAAPTFVASSTLGLGTAVAASERITMGAIGLGFHSRLNLPALAGMDDVQCLAVCDCFAHRRAEGKELVDRLQGNKDCATYEDFRELIAREDIDAVMIMTPSHWKAIHVIESAKDGKDVYCEKPMTLCIREGREMVNAVRRYGRVFQHGTQKRSHWNLHFACELVRNERIGKLKSVYVTVGGPPRDCYLPAEPVPKGVNWDLWLGPGPWRPFNSKICMTGIWGWANYQDYGGGGMTDWGVHLFDIVQWAMGMDDSGPVEIIPPNGEDAKLLTYRYANGVNVYHIGRASRYKIVFEGSDGRIEVSSGMLRTWPEHLMREPTRSEEIHVPRSWPTASTNAHIANFLHAFRTRQRPICDVEIGCRSTTVCHLGNIAYMLKRPLQWDPVTERFTNDAHANRWLDRPRREPWTL